MILFLIKNRKILEFHKSVPRYNKIWNTIWYIFKIALIILFIIVIILIGYAFYIRLKAPRKKRLYEVDDNYDYTPSINANSSLI